MKDLALKIMLIAVSAVFSINAFAAVDPAALERQRKLNKAALDKSTKLQRHFDKAATDKSKDVGIKLDAIPPSPRRGAKTAAKASEQTPPVSPRRAVSSTSGKAASEEPVSAQQK